MEDKFSVYLLGWEGWFRDDSSSLHFLCTLFLFYYINSTSDHQALDPRGWRPPDVDIATILNRMSTTKSNIGLVLNILQFGFHSDYSSQVSTLFFILLLPSML